MSQTYLCTPGRMQIPVELAFDVKMIQIQERHANFPSDSDRIGMTIVPAKATLGPTWVSGDVLFLRRSAFRPCCYLQIRRS